jgi:hypothetical protein
VDRPVLGGGHATLNAAAPGLVATGLRLARTLGLPASKIFSPLPVSVEVSTSFVTICILAHVAAETFQPTPAVTVSFSISEIHDFCYGTRSPSLSVGQCSRG